MGNYLRTTVMPNTMTNANDPRPMTTTAIAQSGIPPTSSSSTEGDGTWFAVTEKLEWKKLLQMRLKACQNDFT